MAPLVLVAAAASSVQGQTASRLLEPEDLFRVEEVGDVVWADGNMAAIVMVRPSRFLDATERRSDIWILNADTKTMSRLTDGAGSDVGFWNPVWSPSGRRLAFLSIDNAAIIRPWVWERGAPQPRVIEDLDLQVGYSDPPIVWLDADSMLVRNCPKGSWIQGHLRFQVYRSRYAQELWRRAREAKEPAVTVLESGGGAGKETIPPSSEAELVLVDLASGGRTVVLRGAIHRLQASPDRRSITFFASNPGVPAEAVSEFLEHHELYSSVNWGSELHVFDVATKKDLATAVRLVDQDFDSVHWSRDGRRLVLLGRIRGSKEPRGLVLYEAGQIRQLSPPGPGRVVATTWLGDSLVALIRDTDSGRQDWWALSNDTKPVNLTGTLKSPALAVFPIEDGKALLSEAGGDLWRISPGSSAKNLTGGIAPLIQGLVPIDAVHGVFQARVGDDASVVRVSDSRVSYAIIRAPGPSALLRSVSPTGGVVLWSEYAADGSRLWLSRGDRRTRESAVELWHGNRWLKDVRHGSSRAVSYQTKEGASLKAWVLLPPDWKEGQRLPFVVVVYPGAVYTDSEPPSFRVASTDFLHPQLFAASGYGVLLPSMPWPDEPVDDIIDRLPIGVLPAADRIIELGLADPERMALAGQSFGGYATLGLLTQTHRFRTAISSAGYSNLLSLYGTFRGQDRYGDSANPQVGLLLRIMQAERGYGGLGGPPWQRLDHYLRNSPVLGADKVETPLMLVHGDMDFVPIQQDEEFFTSLYRQDKRCRFVRYHGEWHTITLKPNVLDLWLRIQDWLGEFLRDPVH
jgi:dipeptidyl aminopeptidase/acylaminoacyl peptidase